MNNSNNRIAIIDQLRGIAAISVVMAHFVGQSFFIKSAHDSTLIDNLLKNIFVGDYINFGRFGVILFFIISGYVIPFSFPTNNPIKGFIISRIFRLYPLFWASLTAVLIIRFYAGNPEPLQNILANITMIPDFLGYNRALDVYWTLAYEVAFYTIVVVIYLTAGPLNLMITRGGALLCALISVAISAAQIFNQPAAGGDKIVLIGFMFLGSAIRKTQIDRKSLIDGWIILIVFSLILAMTLRGYIHYVLFLYGHDLRFENFNSVVVTHALAISVFFAALIFLNIAEFPLLTYLGTISYSIYITHPILMELVTLLRLDRPMIESGWYIPSLLLGTIAISAFTYHAIEQPFTRLGKLFRIKMSPDKKSLGTAYPPTQ